MPALQAARRRPFYQSGHSHCLLPRCLARASPAPHRREDSGNCTEWRIGPQGKLTGLTVLNGRKSHEADRLPRPEACVPYIHGTSADTGPLVGELPELAASFGLTF